MAQSCRRVGIAGLVFAALWGVPLFINNVLARWLGDMSMPVNAAAFPWPGNLIAAIGLLLGIGLTVTAARLHPQPERLLLLGLGFEVATAFLVGLINYWEPPAGIRGVSWLAVVILVYPSIAPTAPRHILGASLIAASMDPLALWIATLRGVPIAMSPFDMVWAFVPNYIAALLAVVPAHIIRTLGRQVRKARELGSYRLDEVLGRGGMGEVYRATHRLLARPAAIKLIRADVLSRSAEQQRVVLERFRREASAVAQLRSPHTIELYDFGVTDDGTFYYVMELLDGLDLETLVTRYGPVPAERASHLLQQAASSLGEAHAGGLIHRDVKPSNIYAARLGPSIDFVKVLDFGLVKALHGDHDVQLTAPHVATGTPAYMSPEVAMGEDPDQRADVYSLGCVAYWLVTGALVFEADNAMKMMYRHIQDAPAPPSTRTELPIPPDLDQLILRCLSKRPDDRPENGVELEMLLRGITFPEPWTDERARRWWDVNAPLTRQGVPCEEMTVAPALASE
jgi:serine/threonine-protein kinase